MGLGWEREKEGVRIMGIFSFSNWMIVTALAGMFHVVNYASLKLILKCFFVTPNVECSSFVNLPKPSQS